MKICCQLEIRPVVENAWTVRGPSEETPPFYEFEKAMSYALQRARGSDAVIRIYGGSGEVTETIRIDNSVFRPS